MSSLLTPPVDVPGPRIPHLSMLRFMREPIAFARDCALRYGDPFLSHVFGRWVVNFGDVEGARTIYSLPPEHTRPFQPSTLAPLIGANSLILIGGESHRRERKLLTPPFHGTRMRAYAELIRSLTRRHSADFPLGRPFDVQGFTQALTLEVIIQAIFGVIEPERAQRFSQAVVEFIGEFNPLVLTLASLRSSLRFLDRSRPWQDAQRRFAALSELLLAELAQRRQDGSYAHRQDILSLLLAARYDDGSAMSDEQIRDEMVTLLLAGHETTAITLSWLFFELGRRPRVVERLRAELATQGQADDAEELSRLPYLDAVCNEAQRLYPVISWVPRTLAVPLSFRGYHLPAGLAVAVSVSLIHSRPDLYPQPDEFIPERFLERKFSPFEFMPFGGGNRRCIGAAFATYEMKIILADILRRYDFSATRPWAPPAIERRNLTLGPRGGVEILVHRAR